ncbi:MAG: hypothetical protein RLO52_34800 [Sandaracinaceae bacterium]
MPGPHRPRRVDGHVVRQQDAGLERAQVRLRVLSDLPTQRPLSAAQEAYAALDVELLHRLARGSASEAE